MNIEEIKKEIIELERADTNYPNVQRLSWLYTVYDHMADDKAPIIANKVQNIMPTYSDIGEFGEVVSGVSIDGLMNVLNEHMEVIKLLYPKEYQAVLQRIREIP